MVFDGIDILRRLKVLFALSIVGNEALSGWLFGDIVVSFALFVALVTFI